MLMYEQFLCVFIVQFKRRCTFLDSSNNSHRPLFTVHIVIYAKDGFCVLFLSSYGHRLPIPFNRKTPFNSIYSFSWQSSKLVNDPVCNIPSIYTLSEHSTKIKCYLDINTVFQLPFNNESYQFDIGETIWTCNTFVPLCLSDAFWSNERLSDTHNSTHQCRNVNASVDHGPFGNVMFLLHSISISAINWYCHNHLSWIIWKNAMWRLNVVGTQYWR